MNLRETSAFLFEPFRLDLKTGALYRKDKNLNLRPKTFDTLVYLLERQGTLVSKNELMENIWADTFVTDDVLVQSIADIRRALGDDARNPTFVRTVPRRGYIFIREAVEVGESGSSSGAEAAPARLRSESGAAAPKTAPHFPRRPILAGLLAVAALSVFWLLFWRDEVSPPTEAVHSIAVLPFEVQSDASGWDWLGQGVPDMIRTQLRNSIPIIGPRSASDALAREDRAKHETTLQAARALGAEKAVVGSVVKLGTEIQINGALVELTNGAEELTFTERAKKPEEVFEAVDAICLKILQSASFEKGLHGAPGPHLTEITTRSLEAYRHYIAGLEQFLKGGRAGAFQAEIEFQEATRIDPAFAMAHLKLAWVKQWARSWGYSKAEPRDALDTALGRSPGLPEMERLAMSAMAAWLVDDDPDLALRRWGDLEGRYPMFAAETGVPVLKVGILVERGLLREAIRYGNPFTESPYLTSDAQAELHSYLARAYRKLGRIDQALKHAEQCLKKWPVRDSQIYRFHLINLGRSYLSAGRADEALACFAQAGEEGSDDPSNLTDAAWGYYMLGRKEQALELVEAALRLNPQYGNAHHLRGWIDLAEGRAESAASHLEAAFNNTPRQFGSQLDGILYGDLPALYFAAVAHARARNQARAEALFARLIDLCETANRKAAGWDRTSFVPAQTYAMQALAEARLGHFEKSRRLREAVPWGAESVFELNLLLSRIHSVQGHADVALDLLQKAVEAGAREFQYIRDNPDFDNLHQSPRFVKLLPKG